MTCFLRKKMKHKTHLNQKGEKMFAIGSMSGSFECCLEVVMMMMFQVFRVRSKRPPRGATTLFLYFDRETFSILSFRSTILS